VSQVKLAKHLDWSWARLNEIINGRRGISANSALAFGEAFGTGPEFLAEPAEGLGPVACTAET